jgi:hypothetical protein
MKAKVDFQAVAGAGAAGAGAVGVGRAAGLRSWDLEETIGASNANVP